MKTLRYLLIAAGLAAGLIAFGADSKTLTVDAAGALAKEWLAHVDGGEYAQSWKEAATRFRAAVTEEKWVAMMEQVRRPLGNVSARELVEATYTNEVPRAPKGDYWIVKLKTSFEGVTANELVTLTLDGEQGWRTVGYFIRPAS